MGIRKALRYVFKNSAIAVAHRFGYQLIGDGDIDWQRVRTFGFAGKDLKYFYHYHNCGWPPKRCTERSVELAIADYWLNHVEVKKIHEIGAVTPYYWPERVGCVIDPVDPHPAITLRKSFLDIDLTGLPLLSISTLEHVGTGDYGLRGEKKGPIEALQKVFSECPTFLITLPLGYNPEVNEFSSEPANLPDNVKARFLVRISDTCWQEEARACSAMLPYGLRWANAVVVMERGDVF